MTEAESGTELENLTVTPKISRRVRYNQVMRLVRRAHLYAGLFMTPWALLYGMTALVYGIVRAASAGWNDRITLAALAAGLVLLALFLVNEARAPQPIMPLRLFASRERSAI